MGWYEGPALASLLTLGLTKYTSTLRDVLRSIHARIYDEIKKPFFILNVPTSSYSSTDITKANQQEYLSPRRWY